MTDQSQSTPSPWPPAVNLIIHLATALAIAIDMAHLTAPGWLQALIGCGQDGALLAGLLTIGGFAHATLARPAVQSLADFRAAFAAIKARNIAAGEAAALALSADRQALADGLTQVSQQLSQLASTTPSAAQLLQALQAAGVSIPNPQGFISTLPTNQPGAQQ
jgi:hypothetical protein